jgi:phosphate uptake regulator
MSSKLNRCAYQKLIDEDIAVLEAYPRSLERDHAIHCVRDSLRTHYDVMPELEMISRRALSVLGEVESFVKNSSVDAKVSIARVDYLREESSKLWERLIKVAEKHDG